MSTGKLDSKTGLIAHCAHWPNSQFITKAAVDRVTVMLNAGWENGDLSPWVIELMDLSYIFVPLLCKKGLQRIFTRWRRVLVIQWSGLTVAGNNWL